FLPNATTTPVSDTDKYVTIESSKQATKEILQQGKNMVDTLKGVVKCSLAHLIDINSIDGKHYTILCSRKFKTT
ncbi:Uncharacterized protein APZ42_007356, partial [Daphnia magna]